MPNCRLIAAVMVTIAFSPTPADAEHLDNGATWGRIAYHTDCWKFTKENNVHQMKEKQKELFSNWLNSLKQDIIASSIPAERDLENKSVSCSFRLTYNAQVTDVKIEQSSGSSEIDKKFLDLINRVNLKKISPPPNSEPFSRGLLACYLGDSSSLSVSLKP
jgi:TonB C terminal